MVTGAGRGFRAFQSSQGWRYLGWEGGGRVLQMLGEAVDVWLGLAEVISAPPLQLSSRSQRHKCHSPGTAWERWLCWGWTQGAKLHGSIFLMALKRKETAEHPELEDATRTLPWD